MEFRQDTSADRYEAVENDQVVGWIAYVDEPDGLGLVHTIVPAEFGGRGVGTALAAYVLGEAARGGMSVLPYCSFVRDYIARTPAALACVPPARRAEFGL